MHDELIAPTLAGHQPPKQLFKCRTSSILESSKIVTFVVCVIESWSEMESLKIWKCLIIYLLSQARVFPLENTFLQKK